MTTMTTRAFIKALQHFEAQIQQDPDLLAYQVDGSIPEKDTQIKTLSTEEMTIEIDLEYRTQRLEPRQLEIRPIFIRDIFIYLTDTEIENQELWDVANAYLTEAIAPELGEATITVTY